MRDVLHLCREYGQSPGWWNTLERWEQAMMVADLGERMRRRLAQQQAARHG